MRSAFADEGVAGLVAAPLFLAAFGLFAGPPSPTEATTQLVAYLADHRAQVFVSTVLLGAGSCLYVWYLAGLRRFVSPEDEASLGSASLLGGLLAVAVVLVAVSVLAGAVLRPLDRSLALVAFDVYNALVTTGGFGFGFSVVTASAAAARSGALGKPLVRTGIAVAALQLATVPGLWVERGFFAPLGPMAVLAFMVLTAWYAAVAWVMVTRR